MDRYLEKNNRERYFSSVGIDPSSVVTADLYHGANVANVSEGEAGMMIAKTDGLVTDSKNLFLSATAADCFLLYFYESLRGVIGITHVGWRGLLAGVIENTIDTLIENFEIVPKNILACISPGIRKCHFEISSTDKEKFQEYYDFVYERENKIFVSLPDIIRIKILNKGLIAERIEDSALCTFCNEEDYFSYRRDKPKNVQVQVGYIGLI